MYDFLRTLLSDKTGGEIFTLFGAWHFFYVALTVVTVAVTVLCFKNKREHAKRKAARVFINVAFTMYMADFFLMPLAYGEIYVEKLPFHACTAMCVLCFFSAHHCFLEQYRRSFVLLGLISNVVYLLYPAGVMWYAVHPLSYRVIQTMLFHSVMTMYGVLTLILEYDKFEIKKCYRDFAVVALMTIWALLGNYAYYGLQEGGYNWFFVVRDPFYIIPESISRLLMPLINIVSFVVVELLIHFVIHCVQRRKRINSL